MTADEILIIIEKMDNEESEKLLILIKGKYNLENKLPMDAFAVGQNYNFWNSPEDDIYDNA